MAAGKQSHENLVDHVFLSDDALADFGAQTSCRREKLLARR
jgi:hypothetical protein